MGKVGLAASGAVEVDSTGFFSTFFATFPVTFFPLALLALSLSSSLSLSSASSRSSASLDNLGRVDVLVIAHSGNAYFFRAGRVGERGCGAGRGGEVCAWAKVGLLKGRSELLLLMARLRDVLALVAFDANTSGGGGGFSPLRVNFVGLTFSLSSNTISSSGFLLGCVGGVGEGEGA